jgi:hypothetical protein
MTQAGSALARLPARGWSGGIADDNLPRLGDRQMVR